MGLVRPAASAPTMRRHAWDVGHTVLGRTAMMLGVLNAILGIYIFVSGYGGELRTCARRTGTHCVLGCIQCMFILLFLMLTKLPAVTQVG
jgi:hypothetical protein